MSSSALRTFAFVLIVVAVAFGAMAYFMNRQIDASPDASADTPLPEQNRVLAVVAVRPLTAYKKITVEDVSLVPISVEPPHYFTDTAQVIGRTPVRGVATGAPVTEDSFGRSSALSQAIPPGTQAMSLSISDVIAVGGFVQPGDFVDVLVYLRSTGGQVEQSQARILMKNIRVLAYQEQLITEDATGDESGTRTRRERTAVLAIPETDTTRVMLGASLGELRLALRAPVAEAEKPVSGDAVIRVAGSMGLDDDAAMPERVSPAARRVALREPAAAKAPAQPSEEVTADQRVVTLSDLARIEERQEARPQPVVSAPTRRRSRESQSATIELFEGSRASRISRPY